MKINASRIPLLQAFRLFQRVVSRKPKQPALSGVLLDVRDDGKCEVIGTDLEIALRIDLPSVAVDEPGRILIPSHRFYSLLGLHTEEAVVLDDQNDSKSLHIQIGRGSYVFLTEPEAWFPTIGDKLAGTIHMLPASDLARLIELTRFCTDDTQRYVTGGVLVESGTEDGRVLLNFVGTDGRRLAVSSKVGGVAVEPAVAAPIDLGPLPLEPRGVIPRRALDIMLDCIKAYDVQNATLSINRLSAVMSIPGVTVSTRLSEGRFPEYRKIIPDSGSAKTVFTLPADQLCNLFERASLVADEINSRAVGFHISLGELVLDGGNETFGRSELSAQVDSSLTMEKVLVDPRYVVQALRVIGASDISVRVTGDAAPVVFACGEQGFQYLVMPMKGDTK